MNPTAFLGSRRLVTGLDEKFLFRDVFLSILHGCRDQLYVVEPEFVWPPSAVSATQIHAEIVYAGMCPC